MLGLGTVGLTTRDQSAPNILIGPIAMPETRLDELRKATVARQNRVRFREVEVSSAGDEQHHGGHAGHDAGGRRGRALAHSQTVMPGLDPRLSG